MNEVWKKIFKEYIECDKCIDKLYRKGIVDEECCNTLKMNLLEDILVTMKSEVCK